MRRSWFFPGLLLAACAGAANAQPTFVVNSLADVPASANVADGVCETGSGNGVCTLRAAVMEANAVAGGGATILVRAADYVLLIDGVGEDASATGDLDVTAAMTIEGDGSGVTMIDGSYFDRVFEIHASDVTLRGITIRRGSASLGGGIHAVADGLTLENVVLSNNRAGAGGGLYNAADVTLRHCTATNNVATNGAGFFSAGGTLHLVDSIVRSNDTPIVVGDNGGALYVRAAVRIERSAVVDNTAELEGGGIYVGDAAAEVVVLNSTIARNGAVNGSGGGVHASAGSVQIVASTISGNTAIGSGGGLYEAAGGAAIFVKNSVLTGNLANNFTATSSPSECGSAPITSGDYNLIAARNTCNLVGATAHVNATNIDPQLLPLTPNGGFAADQSGNFGPTVNAIPALNCTDDLGAPLLVDQRGYRRDGPCDIGAHEMFGGYAPADLLGVELIRNGGASGNELGSTDGFATAQPPFWARTTGGEITQINYGLAGGFPPATQAPAGSGSYFFAGGIGQFSGGRQSIDISALASEIDAGEVDYAVSGAFGGLGADDDSAALTLLFIDDANDGLGSIAIGDFDAADRGNVTGLLPDSADGIVPAGARFIDVALEMTLADGVASQGYADKISLVLPEPSGTLLGGIAIAAILSLRASSRFRG